LLNKISRNCTLVVQIGGQKSGGGGWSRLQPFSDVFGESHQITDFLKIRIHFVPVKTKVFVHKDITEARDWREFSGELGREHSQFTHAQECLMVVAGLQSFLNGNDPMADIEAALGGDFQVAFNDIPQIGIRIELRAGLSLQRF